MLQRQCEVLSWNATYFDSDRTWRLLEQLSGERKRRAAQLLANDERKHKSKPFPLWLATPSASDSLNIVLDVVSDHSKWLEPRVVSGRYQCGMETILLSFGNFVGDKPSLRSDGKLDKEWERRSVRLL